MSLEENLKRGKSQEVFNEKKKWTFFTTWPNQGSVWKLLD